MKKDHLTVGLAQMAPVWLDKKATLDKVMAFMEDGGQKNVDLIAFGEALVPGYPFWVSLKGGARFNAKDQKEIHAHYMDQAIQIEAGHLDKICAKAKECTMAVYLGIIERAKDRGGHSCSMVYINKSGEIQSVHRKLMPHTKNG